MIHEQYHEMMMDPSMDQTDAQLRRQQQYMHRRQEYPSDFSDEEEAAEDDEACRSVQEEMEALDDPPLNQDFIEEDSHVAALPHDPLHGTDDEDVTMMEASSIPETGEGSDVEADLPILMDL